MRLAAATTLLLATIALATPEPVAQPNTDAVVVAQPLELEARNPAPVLEARKKKPKGGSSGNSTTNGADTISASRMLQAAALGLGAMEAVRLWN